MRHYELVDIWTELDLPVLEAAVKLCKESPYGHTTCDEIASATGMSREDVVKAMPRLATR